MNEEKSYAALLIDTSIFDGNGLRLEGGLLGKLTQFKRSPVVFLLPDVIYGELRAHLVQKLRALRSALEKSINEAGDHLFLDPGTSCEAKALLLKGPEVEDFAETRLRSFAEATGAVILECGKYLSVSDLLSRYFSSSAPFSETGKKKNEFPDAIVLMAVEAWSKNNGKLILAITKDNDWSRYCESSDSIDCIGELSDGLAIFNKANAPYAFLSRLESALDSDTAKPFLDAVASQLESELDGFTPDQDADSYLYWEPEGSRGWFKCFHLTSHELRIIETDEEFAVLECKAAITIEVEGDFSLSVHDSIDGDYVHIDSVSAKAEVEFNSNILVSILGDLDGSIEDVMVDRVEIVSPPKYVHFGTLAPDFGGE